jgi:integrase
MSGEQVAGYLARHATESTESTGHTSARLTADDIHGAARRGDHVGRLIQGCWALGRREADEHACSVSGKPVRDRLRYARLRRWGRHAQLRRKLLHQVPSLLHHPRRAAPRPHGLAGTRPTPPRTLRQPRARRRRDHPARREPRRRTQGLLASAADSRLFTGPRDGRITTAVLRDATGWDEVVTRLGYPHLRGHDLRHTGLT